MNLARQRRQMKERLEAVRKADAAHDARMEELLRPAMTLEQFRAVGPSSIHKDQAFAAAMIKNKSEAAE